MKKILFLAAVVCLLGVGAVFGQTNPAVYSGTWILDAGKSKLDERARIESMTMTVVHTDKELKVTTETKRMAPPADAPQGEGRGGGRGMGRGFGAADGTTLVVSRENLHHEDRLRRTLGEAVGTAAKVIDGLGAVSVVGAGINATYHNVRRGAACLQDHHIASSGLATSSFRTTWLVQRDQLNDAVRVLHSTFIAAA